jgi:lysophospholipase L1-like esterase
VTKRARRSLAVAVAAVALVACGVVAGILPGGDLLRRVVREHRARAVREERSAECLRRFDAENKVAAAGGVVFLGSSTIERGPFAALFPNARVLNRGIGDENTIDLRLRLPQSLPLMRPAAVFVYAGSADLRLDRVSPREALARVAAMLDVLAPPQSGMATTPLALIEVLSEVDPTPERLADLRALNAGLAQLAAERGAAFVRTWVSPLVDAAGRLPAELSTDGFHLNEAGYRALADRIRQDGGAAAAPLR